MISYDNFKDLFMEEVKNQLEDAGIDAKISLNTVKKLNDSYEAMTVTPEGESIGVNIPISKFYDAYDEGMSVEEAVSRAVDLITQGFNEKPDINLDELSDYSVMKGKLAMEVVSAETNKEMLETIPHKMMEDMAVVYRFVLNSDEDGRSSILVTNKMIENFGITAEELHADAMENAPQLKPVEIKGMSEVLAELMGVEQAEMMGMAPVAPEDEQMYVATVPDKVHGAGVLAYENFMDMAAERAGGDFYILPSSLHEVLIVPDNGNVKLEDLENMVKEVNATQVAPQDKLTDSVYHYDSKEKIFELGEKFVERQNQKENAKDVSDKKPIVSDLVLKEDKASEPPKKKSVLGDLKAKKEEIAKTPKKAIDKGVKVKDGKEI